VIDRSQIGFTTEPTTVLIDGWRVKLFCQAMGETDEVYWDADAAQAAHFAACPVPPTFLKAIETEHASSAVLLQRMGVPLHSVLHAEQAFEYQATVYVGDRVTVSRTIIDLYDKKDGALTFIVVDTNYRIADRPVATSKQTILLRNQMAAT
jgi:predicted TIM-barrel enzyme